MGTWCPLFVWESIILQVMCCHVCRSEWLRTGKTPTENYCSWSVLCKPCWTVKGRMQLDLSLPWTPPVKRDSTPSCWAVNQETPASAPIPASTSEVGRGTTPKSSWSVGHLCLLSKLFTITVLFTSPSLRPGYYGARCCTESVPQRLTINLKDKGQQMDIDRVWGRVQENRTMLVSMMGSCAPVA